MTAPVTAVASPCINICQMHAASGWCVGCLRTLDEIAAWGSLDDTGRRQVLQRLRGRRVAWRARQAALPTGAKAGAETEAEPGPVAGSGSAA